MTDTTRTADFEALQVQLVARLGPRAVVTDPEVLAPHLVDSREIYHGATPLMVQPASTEEVSEALRLTSAAGIPVVPQGGNTGRVGGATPLPGDGAVLVNLSRMNKIREIDPLDFSITVEAGCILANVQTAAAEAERLFPLSLGAEGSCQIGGNLATNAGGIHVLRYGNMRDLVLGIEVVLPDGRIWNGLKALHKDNTGYDLRHLFLGSEGTLGLITAACLKLFPRPAESVSLFIALRDLEASLEVLSRAKAAAGGSLSACELIPRIALDFTLKHVPGTIDPLQEPHDWYLIMEASSGQPDGGLQNIMETMLGEAYEAGLVTDAAVAASEAQAAQFWRLREALVAAQLQEGASIKHDVSVPVSKVPALIRQVCAVLEERVPGIRPYPFGHMGDGNIHFNLSQPPGVPPEAFTDRREEIHRLVHDITHQMGGSISAEHGIGLTKVDELKHYKSDVEMDLFRTIKQALDPKGLMNPGKMLAR